MSGYEESHLEHLLQTNSCEQCNLVGVNLSGYNLKNANLYRARLNHADLTAADLREANLAGANLGKHQSICVDGNSNHLAWARWIEAVLIEAIYRNFLGCQVAFPDQAQT